MTEILAVVLLWGGVFFVFLASLGLLRMPDFYLRAHTAAKAGTFGKLGLLTAMVLAFAGEPSVLIKCVLVLLFLFLTAPIAMHLLLRAVHQVKGVEIYPGTVLDEYEERLKG